MKVLVAVDSKMMDYHNENANDLNEYILTLMSIVSIPKSKKIKSQPVIPINYF